MMNLQRGCFLEGGTRGARTSDHSSAGVMREREHGGKGLESPCTPRRRIGRQSHDRYDGLLVELLLRFPDMSTRQLCRLLFEHGCPWSRTTVGRARQRLEMCMASGSSQQRHRCGRLEDCDDDHLAAAALDCGVASGEGER